MFSGFNSVSTVPAGSLSNAELVGANTVNGPLLLSVSTSPAALTAATSVVWSAELTAWMDGNSLVIADEKGGQSRVTIANVYQSNGVIHVVDSVLLPK